MNDETHCYDFKKELKGENVTENLADLLQCLVVRRLVIPIFIITDRKDKWVKEDGKNDSSFKNVVACNLYDKFAKPSLMVEEIKWALIVNYYFRRSIYLIFLATATKDRIPVEEKNAFDKIWIVVLFFLCLHDILEYFLVAKVIDSTCDVSQNFSESFLFLFSQVNRFILALWWAWTGKF